MGEATDVDDDRDAVHFVKVFRTRGLRVSVSKIEMDAERDGAVVLNDDDDVNVDDAETSRDLVRVALAAEREVENRPLSEKCVAVGEWESLQHIGEFEEVAEVSALIVVLSVDEPEDDAETSCDNVAVKLGAAKCTPDTSVDGQAIEPDGLSQMQP